MPDHKYLFPHLLSFNKTMFKVVSGSNLGLLRLTSEIKIKFIFGLLIKFYMESTPILNILNLIFRSASFGKLRLSSWIGRKLISLASNWNRKQYEEVPFRKYRYFREFQLLLYCVRFLILLIFAKYFIEIKSVNCEIFKF